MLETCKSIIGLALVILLAIGGFDQPDAAMSLSGSQWFDENGLVYEFNEDASLFSNNLAGFFYVRMSSGEYQQASMDSEGKFVCILPSRTYSFSMDGDELLFQHYKNGELIQTQRLMPYAPDSDPTAPST